MGVGGISGLWLGRGVGLKNSIIRETYYAIYYLNVFQNRKHGD